MTLTVPPHSLLEGFNHLIHTLQLQLAITINWTGTNYIDFNIDNNTPREINGPCLALSTIIPVVVASVAEAEYAALFINAKEGVTLRNIFADIEYP